jgi:hypothetical protein
MHSNLFIFIICVILFLFIMIRGSLHERRIKALEDKIKDK